MFLQKGQEENTNGLVISHDRRLSNTMKSNLSNCQNSSPRFKRTVEKSVVSPEYALQSPLLVHDIKLTTNMKHPVIASNSCVKNCGNKGQPGLWSKNPGSNNDTSPIHQPGDQKSHKLISYLWPESQNEKSGTWDWCYKVSQPSLNKRSRHVQQAHKVSMKKPALKFSAQNQLLDGSSYPQTIKDTTVSQSIHSGRHVTPISLEMDKEKPCVGIVHCFMFLNLLKRPSLFLRTYLI